ncbi:kinase [Thermoplasmatales archaeon AK]|nr:kinase [Thermoplasmatales archaeon AK]
MFKGSERVVSYSPFRISFAGGGTDIDPFCSAYGGAVINATIDRGVTISYKPDDMDLEISSRDFVRSVVVSNHDRPNDTLDTMYQFLEQNGMKTGRIAINSGVPPGSGLGSSSALITALISMMHFMKGQKSSPEEIALDAYVAEKDLFGVTLGRQDPYAVAIGSFKYMEFNGNGTRIVPLISNRNFIEELEKRILLVYTGRTRESSKVLRAQVEQAHRGESETIELLREIKRTAIMARDAVLNHSMSDFARSINLGWDLKKKLGRGVTNQRIDAIIEAALENGGEAARLMGGGSDGFVLVLSRKGELGRLQKAMSDYSDFAIRISFDTGGTRTVTTSGIPF